MRKRGAIEISFSMIFSIIIIIAILGVAFYIIAKFMGVSECTKIGIFYDGLKKYTNEAWLATIHEDSFPNAKYSPTLPSSIQFVCFGNFTQLPSQEYRGIFDELEEMQGRDNNVFLYPAPSSCDFELSSIKLAHVKTENFFCVKAKDGKIKIKTSKGKFDSLVTIKAG